MRNIGIAFGKVTIALIVINIIIFYGIQSQDTAKIYDDKWGGDCDVCKECAEYTIQGYCCPEEACERTGDWVECDLPYCEKISGGESECCIHTKTDKLSLIPEFALSKPWTFITSMFMHGSSGHLLGNMLFLFLLGGILEQILGWRKYLAIYFVSGLIGGMLVLFFIPSMTSVVGASGAIFGVIGASIILRPWDIIYFDFIPMPIIVFGGLYVLLNLLAMMNFPLAVAYIGENVAYSAHFGGAIGGIIFGLYFRFVDKI